MRLPGAPPDGNLTAMADLTRRTMSILAGTPVSGGKRPPEAPDTRTVAGLLADMEAKLKAAETRAGLLEEAIAVERQTKIDGLRAELRQEMLGVLDKFVTNAGVGREEFRAAVLAAASHREPPAPIVFPEDKTPSVLDAIAAMSEKVAAIKMPAPVVQQASPPVFQAPPVREWAFDVRRDELGQIKTITAKPQE